MPVRVVWDNEAKTIITYDFSADWVAEDLVKARQDEFALVNSVEHLVDAIATFESSRLPPNALTKFRQQASHGPNNRGIMVVVGMDNLLMTAYKILQRIYPAFGSDLIIPTDTRQEAYDIIYQIQAERQQYNQPRARRVVIPKEQETLS